LADCRSPAHRYVVEGDVAADYGKRLEEARSILEQLRSQIDN
jgi:hypothetical protein